MSGMRTRKALVIGAGIAGPALAILLGHRGFDVSIFEARAETAKRVGGGLQIAPNGMRVLNELGLADEVVRAGSIVQAMAYYAQTGEYLGCTNERMRERFGQPAVNISRAELQKAIFSRARSEGLGIAFEKCLVDISHDSRAVAAHFSDGTCAEGDFLIGADGVHSAVRQQVVAAHPEPSGFIGLGGFVPRAVLERSGIAGRLVLTFGQVGFFGYGLFGSREEDGAMWWSTLPGSSADAAAFRSTDQQNIKRHLRSLHMDWHDPIPQILECADKILPTATYDIATLPIWRRNRLVLVGDAAHASGPHAAQGASLALEDATILARLLMLEQDVEAAFDRFERERRPRVERIITVARRNGHQKRNLDTTSASIRNQMLKRVLPMLAQSQDWIYKYDACSA